MDKWEILGTRDIKEIHQLLESQFGLPGRLPYGFLQSSKDKLYVITRDLARVDWDNLRINSAGLYFGKHKGDSIRLSIEGSQLIGPDCSKNILDLDYDQALTWMRGDDQPVDTDLKGLVLVKQGDDFMGCGVVKDGTLLNYVPKNRRLPEDIPE